jgi:hypothetical protein
LIVKLNTIFAIYLFNYSREINKDTFMNQEKKHAKHVF